MPNVTANNLQSASHSRLCRVASLLRRVRYAQAQINGPGRSATRHRHSAQLPLLRAGLYPSGRGRQSARPLRQLRRLLGPGNRGAGHPCPSHRKDTSALLAIRGRLQSCWRDRPRPRLLPRHAVGPSCDCGPDGRCIRHPRSLRAGADDHPRRRILFAVTPSTQASSSPSRRYGRILDRTSRVWKNSPTPSEIAPHPRMPRYGFGAAGWPILCAFCKGWAPPPTPQSFRPTTNHDQIVLFGSGFIRALTPPWDRRPLMRTETSNMKPNDPSRTALMIARQRGADQLLNQGSILNDPFAMKILREDEKDVLQFANAHPSASIGRLFTTARSRIAEDALSTAVETRIRQIVILGAGLDTFALRNPHGARQIRIYEVDHPATQAWKRQRLTEAQIALPPSLTLVPVDFERDDLGEQLATGNFP